VPEQCFVGDGNNRTSVIRQLGYEQAVLYECFDEFAALARRGVSPRRTLSSDLLVSVTLNTDQGVQYFWQLLLNIVGQVLEHSFRPLRERSFNAAKITISRKGEHAILGASLIKLLKRKLQQRQNFRMLGGCITQHVIETLATGCILLEAQTSRPGWQANHLADLARAWRHQIVLAAALLERYEFRKFANGLIEIATKGADDPDTTAACQCVEYIDKCLAIVLPDSLLRIHLLHLIDE